MLNEIFFRVILVNKTIIIMAIASTLILSTFALENTASGLVYHTIRWDVIKAPASCETAADEFCGDGKLSSKISLVTNNCEEEISTGIGKGAFSFKGTFGEIDNQIIKLKSNSLQFQNDDPNGITTIIGTAKDMDGNFWNVNAVLDNFSVSNNGKKATADFNLELESQNSGNKMSMATQTTARLYECFPKS